MRHRIVFVRTAFVIAAIALTACARAAAVPTARPAAQVIQTDPCAVIPDIVITLDPRSPDWQTVPNLTVDETQALYVEITGDACFGGGVQCRCPCQDWRPEVKVGDRWRAIPFRRFVVTQEWIGASGPVAFVLPDTRYDDNYGSLRVAITVVAGR